MAENPITDRRVKFDFEVDFSNGGGIQGQDFRLDMAGENITDAELADYIIQDLRLLMVGEVRILNKEIIAERHKRLATTSRFIDLSHIIEAGMITYKGLPAPVICDFLSREASRKLYAEGTEFNISKIEMVSNTGTYLDSPFHRYEQGKDLADLELTSLADLDAIVVRVTGMSGRAISAVAFSELGNIAGKAILVHTGWDSHWRTDQYFEGHPFLTADAAEYLVKAGVALVGIDSYNIDDTNDGYRPVHTGLLGANIPIVEHLCNLGELPDSGFHFSAVPPKVKSFGTFPVRAFAVLG